MNTGGRKLETAVLLEGLGALLDDFDGHCNLEDGKKVSDTLSNHTTVSKSSETNPTKNKAL